MKSGTLDHDIPTKMERILFRVLRIGQLIFSAVVAGITGAWLNANRRQPSTNHKRFIYTEVVAGLGMLISLIFLVLSFLRNRGSTGSAGLTGNAGVTRSAMRRNVMQSLIDFILFILFMVSFGLLTDFIGPMKCGSVFNWSGITGSSQCSKFKADIAFCFLASMFFLATALLGALVALRIKRALRNSLVQPSTI